MDTTGILLLVVAHSAVGLLLWGWQNFLIFSVLPGKSSGSSDLTLLGQTEEQLRPAEFAYLVRRGDMGHALSVLAVDIVQRWAKSLRGSESTVPTSSLATYENNMLTTFVRQVKDWGQEKKELVLLESLKRDPVGYARRMSKLYTFFTTTFRSFLVQVYKDPKHLRKYFSVAGLLRLVSDFTSAGYRDALEHELKEDLLTRGLIVTEDRRNRFARTIIASGAFALVINSVAFFSLDGVSASAMILFAACGLGVCAARLLWALREFVPYYSDLLDILPLIERHSWRVSVLRTVARGLHFFLLFSCTSVFALVWLIGFLIVHLCNLPVTNELLLLSLCTSMVCLPALDLIVTGIRLFNHQMPSRLGLNMIQNTRKKIAQIRPLESFKEMLQNSDYDPTFTELMAIYGVETLFFLA